MAPVVPEDPTALRPVAVKVIGERAAAALALAASGGGGGAGGDPGNNNSTPDVRLLTIQAAPCFSKSQIKAAVEAAGGPPARHQRLLLSNVDALAVLDRRALGAGAGAGGAADGEGSAAGGGGLGVAPCGVASSASLALSGQAAVEAPAPKKE